MSRCREGTLVKQFKCELYGRANNRPNGLKSKLWIQKKQQYLLNLPIIGIGLQQGIFNCRLSGVTLRQVIAYYSGPPFLVEISGDCKYLISMAVI